MATSSAPETKAAAKSKVAFNPYAKKKSAASLASSSAPANIKNTTTCTNLNNTNTLRHLQPPPVNEYTTFSQAFGDTTDSSNACFKGKRQHQPSQFEQELESSTETANSIDESANESTNESNLREHHKMLQPHFLHISTRQRGNPLIAHIRNVPYKFSIMVPDYIFASTRCALFLSLRYHKLHPNYIHQRIAELKADFEYRMLLCHVDIENNTSPLLFLNELCVLNNFTLMIAWSEEEAARYLETVKAFDGKPPSMIQKTELITHIDLATHALKGVRSVNKTDALQLFTQFGSFKSLANASVEELSICPGLGPKKVKRLREVFHRPFSTAKKRTQHGQEKTSDREKTLQNE